MFDIGRCCSIDGIKWDDLQNEFNLEEWKDYLKWNVIRSASPYMDQTFIDIHFDFYGKTLKGKKELKKIGDRAIEQITNSEIAEIMGKVFVDKHFSKEAKEKAFNACLFAFWIQVARLEFFFCYRIPGTDVNLLQNLANG